MQRIIIPSADILWSSLYVVGNHLETTWEYWGHWETFGGSVLITFGSEFEVPSQYVSNFSLDRFLFKSDDL